MAGRLISALAFFLARKVKKNKTIEEFISLVEGS